MSSLFTEKRLAAAMFVVLLAAHAWLLLGSRLLPCTDLPEHLAAATVVRHIGEPGNDFEKYYRVEGFPAPNQAHLRLCALPVFPSVEAANRAIFALYAALLPVALLLVARKLGGSGAWAFLAFPFIYHFSVSWGFAGFALAVPLVLLFYRFFVLEERGVSGPARAGLAAASLVAIYLVHMLAALFALLVLAIGLAGAKRRGAEAAWRLAAALPVLAIAAAWWFGGSAAGGGAGMAAFLGEYYGGPFLAGWGERRLAFILDNYHLFDGARGYAVALVFSLAVALPAVAYLAVRRTRETPRELRPSAWAAASLFLAALACVALLPNALPGQTVLWQRFSVYLFLGLAALGARAAPRRLPRPLAALFVTLAAAHLALWAQYFAAFNAENRGFDRGFLRVEPRGRLAGLVYDHTFRGRPLYIHFPAYYTVWERGIATARFADYRFGAVRRAPGNDLPPYLEWVGRFGGYDGRYAGLDLLLTRGVVPDPRALAGFELVRDTRKWSLFARAGDRGGAGPSAQ